MQSSCDRCGASLEQGSPFCPSCAAPQIRVAAPQAPADEPSTPQQPPSTPDLVPPAAMPKSPNQTGAIQWNKYRRIALGLSLVAGVGIALFLPLGLLFFVASIVFAVGRYGREHQGPLRASQGAKMGAFNGLVSFVVTTTLATTLFHEEQRQQIMQMLQKQLGSISDPLFQRMVHWMMTSQGYVVLVIFSMLVGLAIFLIVSSFIGAVTVSFSAHRDRR